nr:hypothetical protein [Cohnella zeiphila]
MEHQPGNDGEEEKQALPRIAFAELAELLAFDEDGDEQIDRIPGAIAFDRLSRLCRNPLGRLGLTDEQEEMLVIVGQHVQGKSLELFQRGAGKVRNVADCGLGLVYRFFHEQREQLLLGLKIPLRESLADAGFGGDRAHLRPGEALAGEHFEGSLLDLFPSLVVVAFRGVVRCRH